MNKSTLSVIILTMCVYGILFLYKIVMFSHKGDNTKGDLTLAEKRMCFKKIKWTLRQYPISYIYLKNMHLTLNVGVFCTRLEKTKSAIFVSYILTVIF